MWSEGTSTVSACSRSRKPPLVQPLQRRFINRPFGQVDPEKLGTSLPLPLDQQRSSRTSPCTMLRTVRTPSARHSGNSTSEPTSLNASTASGRLSSDNALYSCDQTGSVRHRATAPRAASPTTAPPGSRSRSPGRPPPKRSPAPPVSQQVAACVRCRSTRCAAAGANHSPQSRKRALAPVVIRRQEPVQQPSLGQPDHRLISRRPRIRTGDDHAATRRATTLAAALYVLADEATVTAPSLIARFLGAQPIPRHPPALSLPSPPRLPRSGFSPLTSESSTYTSRVSPAPGRARPSS